MMHDLTTVRIDTTKVTFRAPPGRSPTRGFGATVGFSSSKMD